MIRMEGGGIRFELLRLRCKNQSYRLAPRPAAGIKLCVSLQPTWFVPYISSGSNTTALQIFYPGCVFIPPTLGVEDLIQAMCIQVFCATILHS